MKFIDVRTDFAFKKVFGSEESKDILISFLNAILDFGENPIVDLTIINPYQMPSIYGLKETYVDIKAQLENGTTVIIEMQAYNQTGFGQRILSNLAKAYSTQLQVGDQYMEHHPVIALTVTDFIMFKEEKLASSVITHFQFIETSHSIYFPDNEMEMVFVELPKFKKTESELVSTADKWLYFIKQAGQLTTIPQALALDETINHALKVANIAGLTLTESDIQEKKARWLADQKEAEERRKKAEAEKQAAVEKAKKAEAEKQAALSEKQAALSEKQAALSEKQVALSEKQAALSEKQAALSEKQVALEKLAQAETEKQAALEKLEKAEKLAKLQIAKQMRQANVDIALIMQVTGLEKGDISDFHTSA